MTTPDACTHCGKEWLATCYVCADKMSEKLEAAESRLALLEKAFPGVQSYAFLATCSNDASPRVVRAWARFRKEAIYRGTLSTRLSLRLHEWRTILRHVMRCQ